MFCCLNDHDHGLLAERIDADEKAISDLQKQVKEQPKQLAKITRAKIKELKAEKKTADQFGTVYSRSSKKLIKQLNSLLEQTDPAVLLSLEKEQLIDLVLQGGFAESMDDFIEQQDLLVNAITGSIQAVDPTFTPLFIDNELQALKTLTVQNVFDDVVVPTVAKNVKDSLLSIVVDTPKDQAMSNLAQTLQRGAGTLQTEVRTKIAQFGRSVNMIAADAVGMDQYLYTGPRDGITRPFCNALINKVVSKEQMDKLNNGQGLSVQSSGGGYNCRHSWSPVTNAFVDAAKLDRATAADIADANKGGKRK